MVSPRVPSENLIKNCKFVATIYGTVALEAALLGRKSIIFGHAWYIGCPNTFVFENSKSIKELVMSIVHSRNEVEGWLINQYTMVCVPGFQNPSASHWFGSFEKLEAFEADQITGTTMLVKRALCEANLIDVE